VIQDVTLDGCRRLPLADYLKALGVFRLVAEQTDADARAWWRGGTLKLRSSLDREALLEFFTSRYVPTPIVAPWNGGSGFYAKDTQDGIRAIEQSSVSRFEPYRKAISACRELVARAGLTERPESLAKEAFLEKVRATVADEALRWLDAAVALEDERPAYPPLLGTGGNDGRLDFSNNQMQRLSDLLIESDGSRSLLKGSLFGVPSPRLARVSIGQFRPTSAGGANAGEGFDRKSLVNPWDYVLALEGALVFAVAMSRRLESSGPGAASFPFTVRSSGAGYGSAAKSDEMESRDEVWLPLWSHPASYREVAVVFGEGRATIGTRQARNGVDFARAIASLGVDRGIDEFSRVGFLVRNGLSYFATPLGDWTVSRAPTSGLLDEIDDWLVQLGRASSGKHAPSALRRAATRVDDAILSVCRRGDPRDVGVMLAAIGGIEAVCSKSPEAKESLRPMPALSSRWFTAADDGSVELRLAATLAAGAIRRYISPARARGRTYTWASDDGDQIWSDRPLVDNLIAVARRRGVKGDWPSLETTVTASPADVASFIAGETDDEKLEALVWGLCSVDWHGHSATSTSDDRDLPAVFAISRLALSRNPLPTITLPHTTGIVSRLAAGDSVAATRLSVRRLRGAGLVPRCGPIAVSLDIARRTAAALTFPIGLSTIAALRRQVIRTISLEKLHP